MFGKPLYAKWVTLLEKSTGKGNILLWEAAYKLYLYNNIDAF